MDKQQAQDIVRETFESPFDKDRFTIFVKNIPNKQQPFITIVDQILTAKQQPPSSPFSKPKVGAFKQRNYLMPTFPPSVGARRLWRLWEKTRTIGERN